MKKEELISAIILPFFLIFFLDAFYFSTQVGYIGYSNIFSVYVSALILFSLYGILSVIFKKTKISLSILMVFTAFYSIMNELKIFYMDEPVMLSDIRFFESIKEVTAIIKTTLGDTLMYHCFDILFVFIVSIVFIFVAFKYNLELKDKRKKKVILMISAVILLIFFIPTNITRNFMLENIFKISERGRRLQKSSLYEEYGVIAGLYEQLLESKIVKPKGYDENVLNEILLNLNEEKNVVQEDKKPNIILYFSESFFDISQLQDVKFDKEVTGNFTKLKKEGKLFNVVSPTYGGISVNVEFELFTGANTSYFNIAYIPYLQLFTNRYINNESIIKQFESNGYKTKLLTANGSKLYNCKDAYQKFGIDEMQFLDDEEVSNEMMKGFFISDEYMVEKTIEYFENKSSDEPIFYIMQTMQTHMPYSANKYDKYDIKIEKSNYDKATNDVLLSYAQGIYDADAQLKKLYDYVNTLDEPTIIVFMGDHLPQLKNNEKGEDFVNKIKYFNTGNENINIYRKYNTQALMLANYDIGNFDNANYLGFDLLLTYVMKNAGLKLSEYYNWLYTTKDILPTNNHYISIDTNGNLYRINEMPEEMKKIYDLKEKMQYMFFIKQ